MEPIVLLSFIFIMVFVLNLVVAVMISDAFPQGPRWAIRPLLLPPVALIAGICLGAYLIGLLGWWLMRDIWWK